MNQRLFPMGDAALVDPFLGPPIEVRKAALVFHAMAPQDQAWVLSRLPGPQAEHLKALATELQDLGIPMDEALLREVLATEPPPARRPVQSASTGSSPDSALLARLERADPMDLAALLAEEPAGLVAFLLDLRPWPWADALFRSFEPLRRQEIERSRVGHGERTSTPGHVLESTVLSEIGTRLEALRKADQRTAVSSVPGMNLLAKAGQWWRSTKSKPGAASAEEASEISLTRPLLRTAHRRSASLEGEA